MRDCGDGHYLGCRIPEPVCDSSGNTMRECEAPATDALRPSEIAMRTAHTDGSVSRTPGAVTRIGVAREAAAVARTSAITRPFHSAPSVVGDTTSCDIGVFSTVPLGFKTSRS
jgi:hypothetical protein